MNPAADNAAPEAVPADRCDTRVIRSCLCELCGAEIEQRGAGRPRRYCVPCEAVGKATKALAEALAARPAAIGGVMAALERVTVPADVLSDEAYRMLRSSCFTIASRGRRLAPGSSGRYGRKTAPSAAAPAVATEGPALFPVTR